jgi:hypothetical protein
MRVSTAVTTSAYIELSFEDIRVLLGKYKKNMSHFLRELPSQPLSPRLFCTKSVTVHKPSPTTGQTNTDGGFPSRVCTYSFLVCNSREGDPPVVGYIGGDKGWRVNSGDVAVSWVTVGDRL